MTRKYKLIRTSVTLSKKSHLDEVAASLTATVIVSGSDRRVAGGNILNLTCKRVLLGVSLCCLRLTTVVAFLAEIWKKDFLTPRFW